jgi:hypothetical protein
MCNTVANILDIIARISYAHCGGIKMNENIRFDVFWHLTSFDNMENILKMGLLSRSQLSATNCKFTDLAENMDRSDLTIERKRKELDNYIPFHFLPWNPYDKEIFRRNKGKSFCYITIHQKLACDSEKYKISLKNPNNDTFKFNDLKNFNDCKEKINEIRSNTDFAYGKTSTKDKLGGAMGECLALCNVKPDDFYAIIVKDDDEKIKINNIINNLNNRIKCKVICESGYFKS